MTYNTTIETELDGEVDVIVTYSATKPSKGARDKYGVPLEPDEPAMIEIEDVEGPHGMVELTEYDERRIIAEIWYSLADAAHNYEEEE